MGLSSQVPYYEFALDIILDVDYDDENLTEEQQEMIESEVSLEYFPFLSFFAKSFHLRLKIYTVWCMHDIS